jgi:hypothetical protein
LIKIVSDLKAFGDSLENLVSLVNLYQNPLDQKVVSYYQKMKKTTQEKYFQDHLTGIGRPKYQFSELINKKNINMKKFSLLFLGFSDCYLLRIPTSTLR